MLSEGPRIDSASGEHPFFFFLFLYSAFPTEPCKSYVYLWLLLSTVLDVFRKEVPNRIFYMNMNGLSPVISILLFSSRLVSFLCHTFYPAFLALLQTEMGLISSLHSSWPISRTSYRNSITAKHRPKLGHIQLNPLLRLRLWYWCWQWGSTSLSVDRY